MSETDEPFVIDISGAGSSSKALEEYVDSGGGIHVKGLGSESDPKKKTEPENRTGNNASGVDKKADKIILGDGTRVDIRIVEGFDHARYGEAYRDPNGNIRIREEMNDDEIELFEAAIDRMQFEEDPDWEFNGFDEETGAPLPILRPRTEIEDRDVYDWLQGGGMGKNQRELVGREVDFADEAIEEEKGLDQQKIYRKLVEAGLADGPLEQQRMREMGRVQFELTNKIMNGDDLDTEDGKKLKELIKFQGDNAAKDYRRLEYYGQDTILDVADVVLPGGPLVGNLPLGESREVLKIIDKAHNVRDLQHIALLREGYDSKAHYDNVDSLESFAEIQGDIAERVNNMDEQIKEQLIRKLKLVHDEHLKAFRANRVVLGEYATPEGHMKASEKKRLLDLVALAKVNKERNGARRENMQIAAKRGLRDAGRVAANIRDGFVAGMINSRWDTRQVGGEYADQLVQGIHRRNQEKKQGTDQTRAEDIRFHRNQNVIRLLGDPYVRSLYMSHLQVNQLEEYAKAAREGRAAVRVERDEKVRQNELNRQNKERRRLERELEKRERARIVEEERAAAKAEFVKAAKEKLIDLKGRAIGFLGDVCQMYVWGFLYGASNGLIGHDQVFGAFDWMQDHGREAVDNLKAGVKKRWNWLQRMFGATDDDDETYSGYVKGLSPVNVKSNPATGSMQRNQFNTPIERNPDLLRRAGNVNY